MGRRQGTVDPRVVVSVSEEMANLRRFQTMLNGFWQSSELAYGFFESHTDTIFSDKERPTIELLGHIESIVWFPNNQGRIKHEENIGTTLKQVHENTVHVYRASLLSFYSAFEAYLGKRIGPEDQTWGPFVKTLSLEQLMKSSKFSLQYRTILCADLIREIRNKIVHKPPSVPRDINDPVVQEWKRKSMNAASNADWPKNTLKEDVDFAISQVVDQAVNHVKEAAKKGKELPIELFYMLFTFTNLDSLAFEIEEALLPLNSRTGYSVARKKVAVHRPDLIVEAEIVS